MTNQIATTWRLLQRSRYPLLAPSGLLLLIAPEKKRRSLGNPLFEGVKDLQCLKRRALIKFELEQFFT